MPPSTRSSWRSSFTKWASPCTNACTRPSGKSSVRTASTSASPTGREPRCSQLTSTSESIFCSSSGPEISTKAYAVTPSGSDSRERAIAGSALSSPTSRCQSASGSGA